MGRTSTIIRLSPEENALTDALIRRFRYSQIDVVREELQQSGIKISRSALGRYMKKLGERDGFLMDDRDATVVTIMERSTGHVIVVKSPVRPDALLAHIQALSPADPVS